MVGTGHHVAAREIRRADHVDGPGAARLADPACGRTEEADCVGHFNANGRTRLRAGPAVGGVSAFVILTRSACQSDETCTTS